MQWSRTLDSSLRSTFARLRHRTLGSSSLTPATAACRAPCTAPLPDFSRHLCQTSTGIVDSSLHSTFARPSHHSKHKPAQDPAPSARARRRTLDRSLPRTASISEQQPHSSLTAATGACIAACTAACTAPFAGLQHPAQHLCQTSAPCTELATALLDSSLHSTLQTFARLHPILSSAFTTPTAAYSAVRAQHLCQTSPGQPPAQHLY